MAHDGDDSDVSAITISDDEQPHVGAALRKAGLPGPRSAASTAVAKGGPSKRERSGKGRVAFQLPPVNSAGEVGGEEGEDADGYPDDDRYGGDVDDGDGGSDAGPIEDETKPLGWSYFRKRDASEGPAVWDEVDVEELRFVAENMVRSTTTRASQADEVIQQIFQSNPVEEDALVSDPLGRGYIDPLTLTLGKRSQLARAAQPSGGEKGLKATMRTFRTARLGAKQNTDGAEGAAGGANAAAGAAGLDEDTRKVLPNQEGFDPEAYLATFHADSSMNQLQKGLRVLSRELSERTGQLKLLIRNNFDRFINCKDAIDDIHSKLRKMLVRGGAGGGGRGGPSAAAQQGVGTERIVRSLEQLDSQARRTFGPILERAAKADRIRAVSSLLQRFDHLFAAPHRILELAGRGELNQVVREYKRANMLIRPTATTARVWVSLYAEIEKQVTEVYVAVKQLVSEPPPEGRPMGQDGPVSFLGRGAGEASALAGVGTWAAFEGGDSEQRGQSRVSQLPEYLLFLALIRQERLPAAREEDPMRLYVSRLEAHVEARIQAVDKLHTEQLGQLVTAWMKATSGPPAASGASASASASSSAPAALRSMPSCGIAAFQASLASIAPGDAGGAEGAGGSGNSGGAGEPSRRRQGSDDAESSSSGIDDGLDLDEDGEAAEAAFLLWQGSASSLPFAGSAALPYHIRRDARRLVQDPGGSAGAGGNGLGPAGPWPSADGVPLPATGADAAGRLPSSAHAPEPLLTAGQRQWVSYVCSVSMLLLWSLPVLWATANSPKYGSNSELDVEAKASLERGPSLARRLVESLCSKYATRLKRAVQSLARAGPMQPGLPLVIKDACHLWSSLQCVGVSSRALSSLRLGVMAALGAHVGVLEDHVAALPQLLFGADDFRLDMLAADLQPVTSLPRRLEEELGVVLLHYQWPLQAVADAAGGVEDIPPESGWRPIQGSVFACFTLLSEALAEYARGLYAGRGGEDGGGSSTSRSSSTKKVAVSSPSDADAAAATASSGATASRAALAAGSALSATSLGASSNAAASDTLESGPVGRGDGGGGSSSDDVRMLLVISNSAIIRTRVMPRVVERYRKLLAPTAEATASCQRRLRDLTTSMRRSNEALGSGYLARKEADVQAAVRRYIAAETAPLLAADGTADGAAAPGAATTVRESSRRSAAASAAAARLLPGPSGPSAGCSGVLQLLVTVHNEALTYSPSNLASFMEALVEHLVDQLLRAYHALASSSGVAPGGSGSGKGSAASSRAHGSGGGASVEQLVQLWADLAFLSAALQPLLAGSLAADVEDGKVLLGSAIASRQRSRRYRPASAPAAAVAGLEDGEAVSAALQELLGTDVQGWLRRHALNVRCFAAAAAAAAPEPAAPPPAKAATAAAVAAVAATSATESGSGGSSSSSARGGSRQKTEAAQAPIPPQPQPRHWRDALRSAAPTVTDDGRAGRGRSG